VKSMFVNAVLTAESRRTAFSHQSCLQYCATSAKALQQPALHFVTVAVRFFGDATYVAISGRLLLLQEVAALEQAQCYYCWQPRSRVCRR